MGRPNLVGGMSIQRQCVSYADYLLYHWYVAFEPRCQDHRTLILLLPAPTFFTAGVYVILGRQIQILGRRVSPLSPALYLWIFCTIDVIS